MYRLIDLQPELEAQFHEECVQLRAKGVSCSHLYAALADHHAAKGSAADAETARTVRID